MTNQSTVFYKLTKSQVRTLDLDTRADQPSVTSVLWGAGDCCPALTGRVDGTVNIYTLLTQ